MSCSVNGCDRDVKTAGLCGRHYEQKRVYGVVGSREYKCEGCGETFHSEHKKKYCCYGCSRTVRRRKPGQLDVAAYRASVRNPKHYFTCEECGKESYRPLGGKVSVGSNRFCSMECLTENRMKRNPPYSPVLFSICNVCGAAFRGRGSTCGDACSKKLVSIYGKERAKEAHRRIAKVVLCDECGVAFSPVYGSSHCVLCAPCAEYRKKANMTAAKMMRRAAEKTPNAQKVDAFAVFDRDGWRCQICGRRTPKNLRGTYKPNAPELDHRLPFALGGSHTYSNVQCSCRECNQTKGGTREIGQLNLFEIKGIGGGLIV